VQFNDLVNLILEGDFDPLYDVHFSELSPNEINSLSRDERKMFSLKDKSKRKFHIIIDGEKFSSYASSKNGAIGNIAYNIGLDQNLKTGVVFNRIKKMDVKVFDDKWNVKY
jgi:hypothetical protein